MKRTIQMILATLFGVTVIISSSHAASEDFNIDSGPPLTESTECDPTDSDTELGCIKGPDPGDLPGEPPSHDIPGGKPDDLPPTGTATCQATVIKDFATRLSHLDDVSGDACPGKRAFNHMKLDLIAGKSKRIRCNRQGDILRLYYLVAQGGTANASAIGASCSAFPKPNPALLNGPECSADLFSTATGGKPAGLPSWRFENKFVLVALGFAHNSRRFQAMLSANKALHLPLWSASETAAGEPRR